MVKGQKLTNWLDKWGDVHEDVRTILAFLDWTSENKINLCIMNKEVEQFMPIFKNHLDLVYDYFKINPNLLERDRRKLLESIRQ